MGDTLIALTRIITYVFLILGILSLLVAFILAIGAIGYILFGGGFGEFLKQRRNCVYPFFFILYIVSILLTIYLIK